MLFQFAAVAVLSIVLSCRAQVEWNVIVGQNETLTFTPSSLSGVSLGDTVSFQFVSKNHSVVQSTFAGPCTAAGLSSGFQDVPNVAGPTFPTWSVQVLNATVPLWFFCSQITAISTHCQDGMVFAINPTEAKSFTAFQAAAIATNATSPAGENPSGTSASNAALSVIGSSGATTISSSTAPDPAQTQDSQSTTFGETTTTFGETTTTSKSLGVMVGPTNTPSDISSSPSGSNVLLVVVIVGAIIGGIVAVVIIVLVMRRRKRRLREEVEENGLNYLDLAESEKGLNTRDGQYILPQESTDTLNPFRDSARFSISPFETTSTLNPGPPADSYSFRSTITFVPTESSSVVKFSHTSPIREKASIGGSSTEGIMEESRDSRDQQSGQQSSEMVANRDIWDNSEQAEPSQEIPAAVIPGQPGTGSLTTEEIALLRELRELQIVRRLEEIRDGRSAGAEHEPPPEYE